MIKQYRKKPVVIKAVLWDGENSTASFIQDWCSNKVECGNGLLNIHTLEGIMRADKGDYIIRGVQGEFYPCKPDIFKATYEEVAPSNGLESSDEL